MIVYVNGDSHSAGAEAVNSCAFAEDDSLYYSLGRQPHPDNLKASYGCDIANRLNAVLDCDAESASSNSRIIRTTLDYVNQTIPDLVIIGWATWEREEWLHDGIYYQVNASGRDQVPNDLKEKYTNWVIEQNEPEIYNSKLIQAHNDIHSLHQELKNKNIPHIFFNTFQSFANIKHLSYLGAKEFNWSDCYVDPYNDSGTYYYWLINQGCKTVNPKSYHFGSDAHRKWAEFLYQNYVQKVLDL